MKKITLLVIMLFAACHINAQTSLTAGDIAFVGSNADGATSADDSVAFVLLKDIDEFTTIIFTDRGWNDGSGFSAFPGDGEFTWTSGSARTAGDVVTINLSPLMPAAYSAIGDQLFAIQGSIASPIFIAGLHYNEVSGTSTDANWDGAATTNSTSALPNALVNGDTAVRLINSSSLEQDNWQFSCVLAGGAPNGTPADIRALVHNRANWNSNNSTPYNPALEAGCSFTVVTAADNTPPVITCAATPADITADITGMAAIPDLVTGTSATDDVSLDINITITQSPTAGTMVSVGVHMVTLTAMDEAGNTANCMIAVTVLEPPTTSLFAGDIAFVGFNLDGNDSFAFILLKDVIAGTQIKLTDCGVSNPNIISCNGVGGEGTATWYAPAAMSAGEIVTLPGSFITGSSLSSIGDQIFAYQGTEVSPIFIAAVHSNIEAGTNDSDWDGTNTTNANSALPDQLINGVNAIWLHNSGSEVDNWQFNCSAVSPITGTPSQVAAIINDLSNWINDDFTEYFPTAQSGCTYTINVSSDVNPPVISDCGPTPPVIIADVLGNATVPDLTSAVVATDDVSLTENLIITQSPVVGTTITAGVTVVTLFVSDEGGNTAMCTINVTVNNMVATTLTAGDIAFVGINQDGSDSFAFILLKGILAGTMINFTDCGVNNPNTIACVGANDATNTWFSPTDMPAGSIVTLNASFIGSLGSIGDQLFAYQGDASAPTFIAGIHTSVVSGTNDADWDGANTDGATSALPDQLTNGVNAIRLHSSETEVDNWQFDCSLVPGGSPVSGTPAEVAAIINNLTYWISNDLTEYSPAAKAGCVYILDVIPPVAVCKDITIQLDATGNATIVAADVDGGSTDNVGIVSYAIDKSTFTCSDVSPVTVTLTVTDAAGNPAICTALVTIEDIIIPVITCPEDITQTADTGVCTAAVTLADPKATDNCTGTVTFAGVRSDALELTDVFPLGETTITWTATDAAGNDSETCVQKVTITDDEAPVITCAADIEQTTDDDKCDAVVTIADPTATDNCTGVVTFAGVRSDALPLTDPYPIGETTITWTATDIALNDSETCVQKITISDDQVPVITCPIDITQTTDADKCDAVVTITEPTATDNCTGAITFTGVRSDALALTDAYPVGETTITWTATDEALNDSETCVQKITITDDQVPVITCPADITQTADTDKCNAVVTITDPTATDNCTGTITFTGVRSDALALTAPYPVGETTITWTATDEALNDSEICLQKITITDNEAPVISCPADINQSTDAGICDAIVTIIDPTATDNCTGTVTYAGVRSDALPLSDPYPLGETTITWTATDVALNDSDTCMQKITITDDEAPEITCLADITQTADANSCDAIVVILDPIVTDNCTGVIKIKSERSDGLTLTDPYPIGNTTITWTATDDAFNDSETCEQTITITDDEDPTITCPADIVQTTDIESCDAYIIYDVTSSDNCTGEKITQTAGLPSGSNFPFGTTTNTFVVTDASGNTTTCSFDVTIDKIITTSVVTVTPDNQQYSDLVSFEATLNPGACTVGGQAASTVSFYVGSQYVGTASMNAVSDELVGTLIAPLIESPSYPSNGQMEPGFHDVKAIFGGINPNFTVTDATTSLYIDQEDALVEYTGQSLQATSSSSSSIATVVLTANIQDVTVSDGINDPNSGDIRNAKVMFINRDTNIPISGWITVNNLVSAGDNRTGTVSYNWNVDIGGSDSESITVGIVVDNGYYLRNSSDDNTIITVYKPVGDFVTGGGYIKPTNSAGVYASSEGFKTNFGFNVKYNKKGNKLKGHMNVIFRRMEADGIHTFQIKGNAMESLGVNIADVYNKTAVFITKSNLKDITDPLNPISLGGNLILKVDMTDRGEPGFDDSIAFNLTNSSNSLLYSSNWTGISTNEMLLSGGNLMVHSGFSTGSIASGSPEDQIEIADAFETFEVKSWPNPSDNIFNLKLKSNNVIDEVEIHVFNAIGKLVYHEVGPSSQQYTFGKTFPVGLYIVKITQSNHQRIIRLIMK